MPSSYWSDEDVWLNAYHLNDKAHTVTIAGLDYAEVYDRKTRALVARSVLLFHEFRQPLLLTNTNRRTLQKLFGNNKEACVGKAITIKAIAVEVGKVTNYPIRIFGKETKK